MLHSIAYIARLHLSFFPVTKLKMAPCTDKNDFKENNKVYGTRTHVTTNKLLTFTALQRKRLSPAAGSNARVNNKEDIDYERRRTANHFVCVCV